MNNEFAVGDRCYTWSTESYHGGYHKDIESCIKEYSEIETDFEPPRFSEVIVTEIDEEDVAGTVARFSYPDEARMMAAAPEMIRSIKRVTLKCLGTETINSNDVLDELFKLSLRLSVIKL